MKRWLLVVLLVVCLCSGCTYDQDSIYLFCREEGSGTREMFASGLGLMDGKMDLLSDEAYVTGSGAVMLSAVAKNKGAIGFLSAAAVRDDRVNIVSIDGLYPTDGVTYPLFRQFLIAYKEESNNAALRDFVSFLSSDEIVEKVRELGYFPKENREEFRETTAIHGKITVAGSASVFPLMEQLADMYMEINPEVEIEVQQNDSSTGISLLGRGVVDLAMSSRSLKEGELSEGFAVTDIAGDAIAVIVHPDNEKQNFTLKELGDIFAGRIKVWEEVG